MVFSKCPARYLIWPWSKNTPKEKAKIKSGIKYQNETNDACDHGLINCLHKLTQTTSRKLSKKPTYLINDSLLKIKAARHLTSKLLKITQ